MPEDETIEEWTARVRRERTGADEPPWTVRLAAALFMTTGVLTIAIVAPEVFRTIDFEGTRPAAISAMIAGAVRIGLGVWLHGGSRRSYQSALLTSIAIGVATAMLFHRTGGIRGLEWMDLVVACAPIVLLLLPISLRWRAELTR